MKQGFYVSKGNGFSCFNTAANEQSSQISPSIFKSSYKVVKNGGIYRMIKLVDFLVDHRTSVFRTSNVLYAHSIKSKASDETVILQQRGILDS